MKTETTSRDGTVCFCLGISKSTLMREAAAGGPSESENRIRALVKAGECFCETSNPSGKCCLGDVRKVLGKAAAPAAPDCRKESCS